MKARLARKIAARPIDRLSPYWWQKLINGSRDRRITDAINRVRHGTDRAGQEAH